MGIAAQVVQDITFNRFNQNFKREIEAVRT